MPISPIGGPTIPTMPPSSSAIQNALQTLKKDLEQLKTDQSKQLMEKIKTDLTKFNDLVNTGHFSIKQKTAAHAYENDVSQMMDSLAAPTPGQILLLIHDTDQLSHMFG